MPTVKAKIKNINKRYNSLSSTKSRKRISKRNKYWQDKMFRNREIEYAKKHRKEQNLAKLAYYEKYPERLLAKRMVEKNILSGVLIRPDVCEDCGNIIETEAHHKDYSKPLEVRWLCRACHKIVHRKAV